MVLSWALHDVQVQDLRPGDHVYLWVSTNQKQHGIVLQVIEPGIDGVVDLKDRIIILHFSFHAQTGHRHSRLKKLSDAKVHRSTLRAFLTENGSRGSRGTKTFGRSLKRARYGVPGYETLIKRSGTCYAVQASSPSETVARAHALLEASEARPADFQSLTSMLLGGLSILNSEDFAFFCKTGAWLSCSKVNKRLLGLTTAGAAASGAVVAGLCGATLGLGGALLLCQSKDKVGSVDPGETKSASRLAQALQRPLNVGGCGQPVSSVESSPQFFHLPDGDALLDSWTLEDDTLPTDPSEDTSKAGAPGGTAEAMLPTDVPDAKSAFEFHLCTLSALSLDSSQGDLRHCGNWTKDDLITEPSEAAEEVEEDVLTELSEIEEEWTQCMVSHRDSGNDAAVELYEHISPEAGRPRELEPSLLDAASSGAAELRCL